MASFGHLAIILKHQYFNRDTFTARTKWQHEDIDAQISPLTDCHQ